ncbi:MAG: BamA/TamA family outer membrane protein [Planctomycetota bacterium]
MKPPSATAPMVALGWLLCLVLGARAAAQEQPAGSQTVVAIEIADGLGVPKDVILRVLRTRVGEPLAQDKLNDDIAMLWRDFGIQASVKAPIPVPGGVKLVFTGTRRLEVDSFVFRGNDEKNEQTVRGLIGTTAAQIRNRDDLVKAAQRLEDAYRDDGFAYAQVESLDPETAAGGVRAVFQIYEGPRVAVDDIVFVGLNAFAPRHLRSLMATSESWLIFKSYYKESVLKRDLANLQTFLRGEGFRDARVGLEDLKRKSGGAWVDVVIRVVEGERYTVRSVDVECADDSKDLIFPKEELIGLLKLKPGDAYRDPVVRKDSRALQNHYGEHGYIGFEWLDPRDVIAEQGASIAVTYRFRVGPRKRLRDVIVRGAEDTRDVVIRRVLPLYPGDWFNTSEIEYARNRLRGLGYFYDQRGGDRVRMHHERTGDPLYEDLQIDVEEGPSGFFTIVVGTQTSRGAFAGITITKNNFDISRLPSSPWAFPSEFFDRKAFHGGGQRLTMNLLPGTFESNYEVGFEEPYLFGPQELPWSLALDLHKSQVFFRKFNQDRVGAIVTVGKTLSRDVVASVGLRNELVTISSLSSTLKSGDPLDPTDFELADGDNGVRTLRLRLAYDGRDNYRNPTDGWRTFGFYEHAGGFLGNDVEFAKVVFGAERYVPIYENDKGERHVIYAAAKLGQEREIGGADQVPFFERFFGGAAGNDFLAGSNVFQLRGFDYRGVGPHFGSEPLGGDAAGAATLEYQFPIASYFDSAVRRGGHVLEGRGVQRRRHRGRGLHADDMRLWRLSVGIGLRLKIPVPLFQEIPLKLDYGIPLLKQDEDERRSFPLNLTTRF